jgi:GDP/UDP-N,N'-diacetylbacillosamine 2-epimerase (hydrolysing)
MSRTICVVTGTRADFGLLRGVIEGIAGHDALTLRLLVTGSHLSAAHGETWREIEDAGFTADAKIDLAIGDDSATGIAASMARAVSGFADAYARLRPDVVVLLGDRYEILAAASAALVACIPVMHLHGGEVTEGAIDDAMRHAITKLSHLHCVATQDAERRVRQLGEQPERVFRVGGLGVDAIRRLSLLSKEALEASLGFPFLARNLLVTFHPVTLEAADSVQQVDALLAALSECEDTRLVITLPNADAGNREIAQRLEAFVATHPQARLVASLGQLRYLSCMRLVDAVVGNSSSGLLEAPSLGVATIDIGDRQAGRPRASSVIHCAPTREAIRDALQRAYAPEFRATLASTRNPYGDGGAADRIVDLLATQDLDGLARKRFHDLECTEVPARRGGATA